MAISKVVDNKEVDVSHVEELPQADDITPPSNPPEAQPLILLHALIHFFAPQTLKLISYIKHKKVIIPVDSDNTHNFIHRCISQQINCYIHVIKNLK
jgi:hypothetical protein